MTNFMLAHGEKIIFESLRTVYNLYLNQIPNSSKGVAAAQDVVSSQRSWSTPKRTGQL